MRSIISCSLATALVLLAMGCADLSLQYEADTVPLPETTPLSGDEVQRLHAIRDSIASIRGLEPNEDAIEGIIRRSDFRDYLLALDALRTADQRAHDDAMTISYQQMNILGPGEDYAQESIQSYGNGLLGLYDYRTRALVVLNDVFHDADFGEETIAHEYVHSIQDKAFNLAKLYGKALGERTEYDTTLDCVVEGDAVVTSAMYMAQKYGGEWQTRLESLPSLTGAGRSLERLQSFSYQECAGFVYRVWAKGGWDAVNALFATPPASTEQVLHPEKYFASEGPKLARSIDLGDYIGDGWRLVGADSFGEFDLYLYLLAAGVDAKTAERLASGWGGGEISLYSSMPDATGHVDDAVTHMALVWDTLADFDDFEDHYSEVIFGLDFASLSKVENEEWHRWTWQNGNGGEVGAALWDQSRLRVDILMGTNKAAVNKGTDALADYAEQHR